MSWPRPRSRLRPANASASLYFSHVCKDTKGCFRVLLTQLQQVARCGGGLDFSFICGAPSAPSQGRPGLRAFLAVVLRSRLQADEIAAEGVWRVQPGNQHVATLSIQSDSLGSAAEQAVRLCDRLGLARDQIVARFQLTLDMDRGGVSVSPDFVRDLVELGASFELRWRRV